MQKRLIFNSLLARPEGFEPPTTWFEARYSIQLSYGRPREAAFYQGAGPPRYGASDCPAREACRPQTPARVRDCRSALSATRHLSVSAVRLSARAARTPRNIGTHSRRNTRCCVEIRHDAPVIPAATAGIARGAPLGALGRRGLCPVFQCLERVRGPGLCPAHDPVPPRRARPRAAVPGGGGPSPHGQPCPDPGPEGLGSSATAHGARRSPEPAGSNPAVAPD